MKDIAKAYDVSGYRELTKPQLLAILNLEEQKGTFKKAPKNPYYLWKARYNSDEIKKLKADGFDGPPLGSWSGSDPDEETGPSVVELRVRCKNAGINSFHMSKDQMIEALAKVGDVPA